MMLTHKSLQTLCALTFLYLSIKGASAFADAVYEGCLESKIAVNPFVHKTKYIVGVHATRGLDSAFSETNTVFGEYLTKTAGERFDPPIEFEVVPYFLDGIYNAIENENLDFLYSNPGIYSCIGTEIGAIALTTAVTHIEVLDQIYDLDVYGGVIAVRHDNDDINALADLKDKIIGAGAITNLMGGQMQIYEMERNGMSYVNDPKQIVFTKDEFDVVRGVLSGRFDVGFIRTEEIEFTLDENGNPIDPGLFKIIEPKIHVMEDGKIFPFLHSTDIFPEWPFSALPTVAEDVAHEVQRALMKFGDFVQVQQKYDECRRAAGNQTSSCNSLTPRDFLPNAPCETTQELTALAYQAAKSSHLSGFRVSRSYFELRSVQQEAGFLVLDDKEDWHCTRPSNLYEGISCPNGYFKRSEIEFNNGCSVANLECDDNLQYDCFCKPCVKAFEVDVYELNDIEVDPHLIEYYGEELPGCEKMSICGTVRQGEMITLRIHDNEARDDAQVTVLVHAGGSENAPAVIQIPGTHAYEFSLSDEVVQVQVIEVFVNGKPISQSPIRVMVIEADCITEYGEHSHRVPNPQGECVCKNNTYEIGSICMTSVYFFIVIFSMVFLFLSGLLFAYLGYKKKQNDSVWHISVEELHFNEPPEVIGQGAFGVVILGQYRGTKVAVKRVLPMKSNRGSTAVQSTEANSNPGQSVTMSKPRRENNDKNVNFDSTINSGDIEAPILRQRESTTDYKIDSASAIALERLLQMHQSDNVLRILDSATASDHGSDTALGYSTSRKSMKRFLPLWLRFDDHSKMKAEFIKEMRMLSRLRHPCITTVMGAVIESSVDPMLIMEYMEYGSLHDLLRNETMSAGGEIILQIVRDFVQGIQFLHASKPPILHGDLKAKNILVDSRFRAKVADFGFSHFKTGNGNNRNVLRGTPFFMAPEYLRRRTEYTTACDIYALGMIIFEIYARADPFEGEDPRKVLPKICHPRINKRPPVPESCPPRMADLMKKCWSANPFFRPSAKDMDYLLVEMSAADTEPLENAKESWKKDNLHRKPTSLHDVFPKHIADALNAGKKVEAESHEVVTVVFSDIIGFTTISETFSAMKVSNLLDRLYHAFDALATKHNIFKVETIGDAYMGVTNLDGTEYDTHVKQVAEFARDAVVAASRIQIDEDDPARGCVQIRVGFHSGPVVSNVIGSLNPRYGLFGDTVNTASRMESNSTAGRIHCSATSAKLLETQDQSIKLTLRGFINVKGKGKMKTYWVWDEDIASTERSLGISSHEFQMEDITESCEEDGSLIQKPLGMMMVVNAGSSAAHGILDNMAATASLRNIQDRHLFDVEKSNHTNRLPKQPSSPSQQKVVVKVVRSPKLGSDHGLHHSSEGSDSGTRDTLPIQPWDEAWDGSSRDSGGGSLRNSQRYSPQKIDMDGSIVAAGSNTQTLSHG